MGCATSNCCKTECDNAFHLRQKSVDEINFLRSQELRAQEKQIQMRNYIDQVPDFTKFSQDKSDGSPFVTAKVRQFS